MIPETILYFEWGASGLTQLASVTDVVVIVDVLSFSTCVDVAVSNGAVVYPFHRLGAEAAEYARSQQAVLAGKSGEDSLFWLSPSSLQTLPAGSKIVLPSPNGSRLSLVTGELPTMTGCLRNAGAVAECAQGLGSRIAVIAAGERWPDGSLRPAVEDLLGAGAILSRLNGWMSAEAQVAVAAYRESLPRLEEIVSLSVSGQELIGRGRIDDVHIACEVNVSESRPVLIAGGYVNLPG